MDGDEDMEETFGKRSKHGGDFGEEYRAKVDFTSGGGGGVDFTSGVKLTSGRRRGSENSLNSHQSLNLVITLGHKS